MQPVMVDGVTLASVWMVPYQRNPHFMGRDDLLGRLHRAIAGSGKR